MTGTLGGPSHPRKRDGCAIRLYSSFKDEIAQKISEESIYQQYFPLFVTGRLQNFEQIFRKNEAGWLLRRMADRLGATFKHCTKLIILKQQARSKGPSEFLSSSKKMKAPMITIYLSSIKNSKGR